MALMKIKSKLALAATALSTVTFLMVWTFAFQAGVTTIRERTQSLIDFTCRQVQHETADLIEEMADQSRLWSAEKTITAATASGKAVQLTKHLDAILAQNQSCKSLLVVARSGKLLAVNTPQPSDSEPLSKDRSSYESLAKDLKQSDAVKQALKGRFVPGPDLYRLPGKISSPLALWQIASPITSNGKTVGALLASYSWDAQFAQRMIPLLGHLEQAGLPQAQINILDPQGTIIASTHPELLGQPSASGREWTSFYPATILGSQQTRIALRVPQAPLNQVITSLKARSFVWALAGSFALLLGLYVLGHLLFGHRLDRLLGLSRQLLRTVEDSQPQPPPSCHGDEIKQLAGTLARANVELVDRQENMQNLLSELTSLNKELTQVDQLKNEFVANMSHEIRTPMNGILGFAELLSQEKLTTAQSEYVDTILKCGTNLLTLINDVLDLARIEAGHLQIRPQQ